MARLYTYEAEEEVSNHVDSGDGEITTVEIDGEPLYQSAIEPIPGQHARDMKALALKS